MHLERAHGILVVGGGEDHRDVVTNQLEDIEPGKLRHLHIKKDQLGLVFGEGFDGLESVGALGKDFDFSMRCEEFPDDVPRKLFVVDDKRADFLLRAVHLCVSPVSAGMDSSTRNGSACESTRRLASVP